MTVGVTLHGRVAASVAAGTVVVGVGQMGQWMCHEPEEPDGRVASDTLTSRIVRPVPSDRRWTRTASGRPLNSGMPLSGCWMSSRYWMASVNSIFRIFRLTASGRTVRVAVLAPAEIVAVVWAGT